MPPDEGSEPMLVFLILLVLTWLSGNANGTYCVVLTIATIILWIFSIFYYGKPYDNDESP